MPVVDLDIQQTIQPPPQPTSRVKQEQCSASRCVALASDLLVPQRQCNSLADPDPCILAASLRLPFKPSSGSIIHLVRVQASGIVLFTVHNSLIPSLHPSRRRLLFFCLTSSSVPIHHPLFDVSIRRVLPHDNFFSLQPYHSGLPLPFRGKSTCSRISSSSGSIFVPSITKT